jgi:hypothetical protein
VFLCSPLALEIGLYPPFRARLWLAGLVHLVEHLKNLLTLQLGIYLAGKQPYWVDWRSERAICRVDRDESVVGPREPDQ